MWYLVKYNSKVFPCPKLNHGNRYAGVGGDIIPLSEFDTIYHNNAHSKKKSIWGNGELPHFVWTDRIIAEEYYNYSLAFKDQWKNMNLEESGYLLGVNYAEPNQTRCDGFDFGCAGGGVSIIELEIIGCKNTQKANRLKDKYLNDFYLFRTLKLMEEYLNTERSQIMRGDDEYYDELAITVLRSPFT